MANDFLPNSYQTPNVYVDDLMHLVTDQEWKVISYALRRIYGFNKRQDKISLTQFADGTRGHDGKILDHGTGLGRNTCSAAIKSLVAFGIFIKVGDADNDGQCYALQTNPNRIDMSGLESRKNAKFSKNQHRTIAATTKKKASGGTSDEPLGGTSDEPLGGTSDEPLGGTSDEPLGGTSDDTTITSRKPVENQQQQPRPQTPHGEVVVVVDSLSEKKSKPENTPTYQLLRYHKIGAAREFAHEPLDLITAYLDRVRPNYDPTLPDGQWYHPAQIVEDLRAGLHRTPATVPAPNQQQQPAPADDPLRPIWISPQHWAELSELQRDVMQRAALIDGKIEAQKPTWTTMIYTRWPSEVERLVTAAKEMAI